MKSFFIHFKTEMIVGIIFIVFASLLFFNIEDIKMPIYFIPLIIIIYGITGFIFTVGWKKTSWLFNFLKPKQHQSGTVVVVIDDRRGNVFKGALLFVAFIIRIYLSPFVGLFFTPILIYKYLNQ
jgi:hypothetical protein